MDQFSFLGNRARYEFIELDMSTVLDLSIPSSRRISSVFWATELYTSLSSSICQPASICRYRGRGLSLFRGDKVKMVIEVDDLPSSMTYRARWPIELGFSREEKREKMEIKAIMTTSSTKSKTPSRSQFLTDKKHCVAGRLMLFSYLKKYWQKNFLFYPFFFDILDARPPSVNGAWIERFSFKTQTSHQPCVPCKSRIHLKKI